MRYLRIAERLFNRPLMVSESKLNVLLSLFGQRSGLALAGLPTVDMIEVSDGDRRRAGYSAKNGIGLIGIYGPLMHRRLDMEFPSGGPTTYAELRQAFDLALADDAVQGIVLDIDSPGGEVSGAFDLADHIYRSRSIKPITAVVNESAYSAAYLLASAASRIVIPRTGGAGSIGVIATHADFSRAEEAQGITVTHVYAGARKADFSPHVPLSPEAVARLQETVNDTYALFVDTVARHRGLKTQAVRDTQAGIFEGEKAVAHKLADEVSAVDHAIANAPKGKGTKLIAASTHATRKEIRTMKVSELKEQNPDLVAQIEAEARKGMIAQAAADAARQEAVTAERNRVLAILGIPGPAAQAHRSLLMEGIREGQSAGDVSLAIHGKEAELLAKAAEGIKTGAVKPAPVVDPGAASTEEAQAQAAADALVKAADAWNKRN